MLGKFSAKQEGGGTLQTAEFVRAQFRGSKLDFEPEKAKTHESCPRSTLIRKQKNTHIEFQRGNSRRP
jgi:hypothetical protein